MNKTSLCVVVYIGILCLSIVICNCLFVLIWQIFSKYNFEGLEVWMIFPFVDDWSITEP